MLLEILRTEFSKRQKRNSKYSLRSFARSLKIHSSTLSAILNGKRKISPLQAQKILLQLDISSKERKGILLRLINEQAESSTTVYHQLSDDIFNLVSGWEHFALLSCLDLSSSGQTAKLMADKLKISDAEALMALNRLKKFNLVRQASALWYGTGKNFTTTDQIPSEAVRKTHREYIEKALASLDNHSVEERDISGITLAVSSAKLNTAKKMILNFRRELADFLESDSRDEVYRLNIQLFPLTK